MPSAVFLGAGYLLSCSFLLIGNKLCVQAIPAPAFVHAAQFTFTVLAVKLLEAGGWTNSVDAFTWERVRVNIVFAIVSSTAMYFNMAALKSSDISTMLVIRACCPLCVCVIEHYALGRALPSRRGFCALVAVALGALGYFACLEHKPKAGVTGLILCYFVTICTADTFGKWIVSGLKWENRQYGPVLYSNVLAIPYQVVVAVITDEAHTLTRVDWTGYSVMMLVVTCVFGLSISYFGWCCRDAVSATEFALLGIANKVLSLVAAAILWEPPGVTATAFLVLCLAAATEYAQPSLVLRLFDCSADAPLPRAYEYALSRGARNPGRTLLAIIVTLAIVGGAVSATAGDHGAAPGGRPLDAHPHAHHAERSVEQSAHALKALCRGYVPPPTSASRNGVILHKYKFSGGFGNMLIKLFRALEVAVLLERQLWVYTAGADIEPYWGPQSNLSGLVRWTTEPPPQASTAPTVPYDSLLPLARKKSEARRLADELKAKHPGGFITLGDIPQAFPGWLPSDGNILPSMPCLAALILTPTPTVSQAVSGLLERHGRFSVALHARTSDADMVRHMTGRDDVAAALALNLLGKGRRLGEGRRLALTLGVMGEHKPGCDRDFMNFTRIAACGAAAAVSHQPHHTAASAVPPLSELTKTMAVFQASDSSPTDGWFRDHYAGLIQSEGEAMHTGREVQGVKKTWLGKVYIDFFALSRAKVLVVNCPAESSFQLMAKMLRDAHGLPTYRAMDCSALAPYPASTHFRTCSGEIACALVYIKNWRADKTNGASITFAALAILAVGGAYLVYLKCARQASEPK